MAKISMKPGTMLNPVPAVMVTEYMEFDSPLPPYFEEVLDGLRKERK